jgi:hypothetical protein
MRIIVMSILCMVLAGCAIVRVEHNVSVNVENCNADIKGLGK